MKKIYIYLGALAIIIVAGLVVYQNKTTSPNNGTPIVGNDRDAHGCIGSAGYSWCEAKQKCIRIFEEDCLSAQSIREILANKYNKDVSTVNIKIDKENTKFAEGSVSFGTGPGEGGIFLAVKINDKWQVVFDGNGNIDCKKIISTYNFPTEMLTNFCPQ